MHSLIRNSNGQIRTVADPANLPERRAVITAIRTSSPHGSMTVIAAGSLDPADTKTAQALELSAVLGAIALLAVAVVAWLATGRTLRRVECLRDEVSAITTSGDLTRRVAASGSDELGHLGSTLNEMVEAMSVSSERQRRFVADAAHELRTPIAGLAASLDVALRHPETIDQEAWIIELVSGHSRLGQLVNDLLVLAAIDGGAPTSASTHRSRRHRGRCRPTPHTPGYIHPCRPARPSLGHR